MGVHHAQPGEYDGQFAGDLRVTATARVVIGDRQALALADLDEPLHVHVIRALAALAAEPQIRHGVLDRRGSAAP